MLVRMSRRTTPFWFRMFGPLEPSPGKGPTVSWGMRVHVASAVDAVVELDDAAVVVVLPPGPTLRLAPPPLPPQPARNTVAPTPPSRASSSRRVLGVVP